MMTRKTLYIAICGIFLLALSSQAAAQPSLTWDFALEGAQENPPVVTDATGNCTATLDLGSFVVDCVNNVQNISMAHIHMAPPGVNGPIVFHFAAGTAFSGTVTEESLAQQAMDFMGNISPISFETFLELLNSGGLYVNVHSDANPTGEIRGQIPPPPGLFFAQFGNGTDMGSGASIVSDIVLINTATTGDPIIATVDTHDDMGNPIDVMFEGGSNSAMIDPLQSVTLRTDGMGDLVVGSAIVNSTGPIAGTIRFGITGFGVAGVPSSAPLMKGIVPTRNEGNIRSSLAIRNTSNSAITVMLTFREGETELTAEVNLGVNARTAQFVDEIFPELAMTEFNGTVEICVDEGSFSALALELGTAADGSGVLTTLPVSPVVIP